MDLAPRLSTGYGSPNVVVTAKRKSRQSRRRPEKLVVGFSPNITDDMRSGPDQRPRGRFNPNRPFRQKARGSQQNQTFDSNGPNVKLRGSAYQIFERYVALAREAATGDDRIAAENFYQHAEHYFRISNARREGSQQGTPPPPTTPADVEINSSAADSGEAEVDRSATPGPGARPQELFIGGGMPVLPAAHWLH